MSASPPRPQGRRVQLGSPVVAINPSGTYLRHRAAAERAYLKRRRTMWWRRALLVLLCAVLYAAIGRDLLALARAKKQAAAAEIRLDMQTLTKDVERIAQAGQVRSASESTSPVAFTSAAALARATDSSDIDAWLSDNPVETTRQSR